MGIRSALCELVFTEVVNADAACVWHGARRADSLLRRAGALDSKGPAPIKPSPPPAAAPS